MSKAVIAMGSNLGERQKNIDMAINALKNVPNTKVIDISTTYVTEPFKVTGDQPDFFNCCVLLETSLSPHTLLGVCLGIESQMGRMRINGEISARCIDLDLLLYENYQSNTDELTVPHPRMQERAFVLMPLNDLFPDKNALGWDFKEYYNKEVTL